MGIDELLERFDDEWLHNVYAAGLLDGEGLEDRRNAQLCAVIHTSSLNTARLSGATSVRDTAYRSIESFMPNYVRTKKKPKRQSWTEMKRNIGF